jgi:transposase-like protein
MPERPRVIKWSPKRKAGVVIAVASGGMTAEQACATYDLSEEELAGWRRDYAAHGVAGLRATQVQIYHGRRRPDREPRSRRPAKNRLTSPQNGSGTDRTLT